MHLVSKKEQTVEILNKKIKIKAGRNLFIQKIPINIL